MPGGFRDLKVYQISYDLGMQVFRMSRGFPIEERYALTDQIRRSSRSVPANIAEGYRKRQYPRMFSSKMSDADGEAAETQVWLDYARDCEYIDDETHKRFMAAYEEVGKMLGAMIDNPDKFKP